MKQVVVLRHSTKDQTLNLSESGRKKARELRKTIGRFDIVISSDKKRGQETAFILTRINPTIDTRAGLIPISDKEERELTILEKENPLGISGVVFGSEVYRPLAISKGNELVDLIKETLEKLPKDSRALIISHESPIVVAYQILKKFPLDKAVRTVKPLEGFVVSEDLIPQDF